MEEGGVKALSIRQPWAHMILYNGKDIENRTWPTKVRGRVLIHASQGMTKGEWYGAWRFAYEVAGVDTTISCPVREIHFGGIVGSVEIVECVDVYRARSKWFEGPNGFALRNPVQLPFYRCCGKLGFFDVQLPYPVCRVCGCHDSDCQQCIELTGEPCHWVAPDLCSACVEART